MDLTFSSCSPLQPLPRLVYALLRSPLLSSAAQYHSDLTAYLHHLGCCLPPRELAKAVYPGALLLLLLLLLHMGLCSTSVQSC